MPCVNLGVVSFGCDQKQEMKILNKMQDSILQSIQNNASAVVAQSAVVQQEIDLREAQFMCSGEARVEQKIQGKFEFVANVTNNLTTDIKNDIKQSIDSAVKANQSSVQNLMDRAGAQISAPELVNQLNSAIDTRITNDLMTRVAQNLATAQKINMRGATIISPTCIVTQSIMLEVFASAIIKQASAVVLDNAIVKKMAQVVENDQAQETGLTALEGVLYALALVMVIGLIIYLFSR